MLNDEEFLREFECSGKWWLPKDKRRKFSGTLKFDIEHGGTLELVGIVGHIWNFQLINTKLTIFGTTNEGKISLFNCTLTNMTNSKSKLSSISFKFDGGVIGRHVLEEENLSMKSVKVYYSYLNVWSKSFRNYYSKVIREIYNDGKENASASSRVDSITNYYIKLTTNDRKSYYLNDTSEVVKFEETPYIELFIRRKKKFKEYQKLIKSIQYFLSLSMREQVYPLSITGETSHSKAVQFFSKLPTVYPSETLLVMNFTLNDVKDNISKYLKNWIDNAEEMDLMYELYFSSLDRKTSPELTFTYLAEAIESLSHLLDEEDNYIPDEDYNKEEGLRKFLEEKLKEHPSFKELDKGAQDSLVSKLGYFNEYTLRTKLKLLLSKENLEIINSRKGISKVTDKKKFVQSVVDTRNYFAHRNPKLKNCILKDRELENATKVLRTLLEIILMAKIGVSSEEIKNFVEHPTVEGIY